MAMTNFLFIISSLTLANTEKPPVSSALANLWNKKHRTLPPCILSLCSYHSALVVVLVTQLFDRNACLIGVYFS